MMNKSDFEKSKSIQEKLFSDTRSKQQDAKLKIKMGIDTFVLLTLNSTESFMIDVPDRKILGYPFEIDKRAVEGFYIEVIEEEKNV